MELKKAILNYILDNSDEFQLINSTVNKFREYIYDSKGEFLFGGEKIHDFILESIKLLNKYSPKGE